MDDEIALLYKFLRGNDKRVNTKEIKYQGPGL